MIKCPECGSGVAENAEVCEFCGYPLSVEHVEDMRDDNAEKIEGDNQGLSQNLEVVYAEPDRIENESVETSGLKRIVTKVIICIFILAVMLSGGYMIERYADVKKEYQALSNNYRILQSKNSEYQRAEKETIEQYNALAVEHNECEETISSITEEYNTKISEYEEQIALLNAQVSNYEIQVSDLKSQLDSQEFQQQTYSTDSTYDESNDGGATRSAEPDTDYGGGTVYWTPGGSVYHSTSDCPSLGRSNTVSSGSVASSGKSRGCKLCT